MMEAEKEPLDEKQFPPVFVQPYESVPVLHIVDGKQVGPPQKPKWSWCQIGTSLFAMLCCCSPFGLIGLVYSMLAYVDHKSRDFARVPKKKSCAWGWTITAIVLGSLLWITLIGGIIFNIIESRRYYDWGGDWGGDWCGTLDDFGNWSAWPDWGNWSAWSDYGTDFYKGNQTNLSQIIEPTTAQPEMIIN